MAIADLSTTTGKVARQYDAFPYPHRDPAEEANRLLGTTLDELGTVNHYCFRGRRDFRRGFRVLIAGGGTGDGTIFLAQQLADTDAEIVHLDLSATAIEVARQRAVQRHLDHRISWVRGSLLDLPALGLGTFDYLNCCGVLHHLDDPSAGLEALKSVLKDDGAMAIMVYGRYGRTGIYQMQQLMRLINHAESDPQSMVANAQEVLAALPPFNSLKRPNHPLPVINNLPEMDDAEVYDMFLHAKDRPFSVLELYDWLDGAGLHLVEFSKVRRFFYDAQSVFTSPKLLAKVQQLPVRQQQAVAELTWGTISKHAFWVSSATDTMADPRDPDNVPYFTTSDARQVARTSMAEVPDGTAILHVPLTDTIKISRRFTVNATTRRLIELIDGRRTMGEIVGTIVSDRQQSQAADEIWHSCCGILETFRGDDLVLLRHASVPAIEPLSQDTRIAR